MSQKSTNTETTSTTDKNPYVAETPEWQLCELAISSEHAARAFAADANRFTLKSTEQRLKAEKYRVALKILTAGK